MYSFSRILNYLGMWKKGQVFWGVYRRLGLKNDPNYNIKNKVSATTRKEIFWGKIIIITSMSILSFINPMSSVSRSITNFL